jgi:hypothetical protein
MIRSIALTLAGAALIGLTLVSTDVSARRGGGGGHSGGAHVGGHGGAHIGAAHVGGFRAGGFRSGGRHTTFRRVGYGRRIGVYGYSYRHSYSCWRLRPTRFGLRRVWVCGYPYRRYGYPY